MIDWLYLHTPLYLMTQSFWQDEAFSFLVARLSLQDIIKTTALDFNPPLYYFLLHFWMKFFGTGEVAIRSLSLIFFAGSIFVFSLILENILHIKGKKVWVYSLLFALNPYLLYYAFEARMYSLFAFLSVLSFYFFLRKNSKGYIVATLLGLYTHYFFILVVMTQCIYTFFNEREKFIKKIKLLTVPVLLFLPWALYTFPFILKNSSQTWVSRIKLSDVRGLLGVLYTGYEPYWGFYQSALLPVSIVLALIIVTGLYYQKKRDHRFWLFALWSFLFFTFVFLLSLVKPLFVPRYLIFAPLGFILFLIYLVEKMPRKVQLIVVILLFLITFHYTYREVKLKRKGDMRKTVLEIRSLARDGDEIYLTNPIHYFTVLYYFKKDEVYILRNYNELPVYLGLSLIPKKAARPFIPPATKRAFIIEGNSSYSFYRSY